MEDLNSEIRITQKNRLCWTYAFFGAIIVGVVLFFLLSISFDLFAVLGIIFLIMLVYTTLSELATKTLRTFYIRSIMIFPLGSIFTYVLNYLARKYVYAVDDPYGMNFTIALFMVLLGFVA